MKCEKSKTKRKVSTVEAWIVKCRRRQKRHKREERVVIKEGRIKKGAQQPGTKEDGIENFYQLEKPTAPQNKSETIQLQKVRALTKSSRNGCKGNRGRLIKSGECL